MSTRHTASFLSLVMCVVWTIGCATTHVRSGADLDAVLCEGPFSPPIITLFPSSEETQRELARLTADGRSETLFQRGLLETDLFQQTGEPETLTAGVYHLAQLVQLAERGASIAEDTQARALSRLAWALEKRGDADRSRQVYHRLITQHPDHPDVPFAYAAFARYYLDVGDASATHRFMINAQQHVSQTELSTLYLRYLSQFTGPAESSADVRNALRESHEPAVGQLVYSLDPACLPHLPNVVDLNSPQAGWGPVLPGRYVYPFVTVQQGFPIGAPRLSGRIPLRLDAEYMGNFSVRGSSIPVVVRGSPERPPLGKLCLKEDVEFQDGDLRVHASAGAALYVLGFANGVYRLGLTPDIGDPTIAVPYTQVSPDVCVAYPEPTRAEHTLGAHGRAGACYYPAPNEQATAGWLDGFDSSVSLLSEPNDGWIRVAREHEGVRVEGWVREALVERYTPPVHTPLPAEPTLEPGVVMSVHHQPIRTTQALRFSEFDFPVGSHGFLLTRIDESGTRQSLRVWSSEPFGALVAEGSASPDTYELTEMPEHVPTGAWAMMDMAWRTPSQSCWTPEHGTDQPSGWQRPSPAGTLSSESIQRPIRGSADAFAACTDGGSPDATQRIVLRFTIDQTGRVYRARIDPESASSGLSLQACALRTIRQVRFERPEGGAVQVAYPLTFGIEEESL